MSGIADLATRNRQNSAGLYWRRFVLQPRGKYNFICPKRGKDVSLYLAVSSRTFVCLTNIPTPYRLFQFARMHEQLSGRGLNFEVWFMARSEPGRSWTFADSELQFPHCFLPGKQFRLGSDSLHFNPSVTRRLRETRPEILLIAGGWTNPTVWLASMSAACGKTIFWSESHCGSVRRNTSAVRMARRIVLNRFEQFAVPGALAREYVEQHAHPTRFYGLPNLVDPEVFSSKVENARKQNHTETESRTLLIVARLSPEKGLLAFLRSLLHLNTDRSRLTLLIAGAGPLRSELQSWIAAHDLDIRLLGHLSESEMISSYANADGFCLPSISDPNPLSVIEAMWAGLPLVLSSRVGNHPECLEESQNGFLFDPLDPEAAASAVSRWLNLAPWEVRLFGERSRALARERFDPDSAIERFLDDLLAPSAARKEILATNNGRDADHVEVGNLAH